MSKTLKAGDLALTLVPDSRSPCGSAVLLVERVEKGQMLYGKDRQMAAPTAGWYVTQPGSSVKVAYGDSELMPLRGSEVPTPKLEVEEICYLFGVRT